MGQNKALYDLDRQTVKISALPSGNVSLQDVFKTCLQDLFQRRIENVFARRVQDIFKTSSRRPPRRLQDVSARCLLQDVFKTS